MWTDPGTLVPDHPRQGLGQLPALWGQGHAFLKAVGRPASGTATRPRLICPQEPLAINNTVPRCNPGAIPGSSDGSRPTCRNSNRAGRAHGDWDCSLAAVVASACAGPGPSQSRYPGQTPSSTCVLLELCGGNGFLWFRSKMSPKVKVIGSGRCCTVTECAVGGPG